MPLPRNGRLRAGARDGLPYAAASFVLALSFGVVAAESGLGARGDGTVDRSYLFGHTGVLYVAWVLGTLAGVVLLRGAPVLPAILSAAVVPAVLRLVG